MNVTEEQARITHALHSREHTPEETEAIEAMRDRAYSQFAKALSRVAAQAELTGTPINTPQEVS